MLRREPPLSPGFARPSPGARRPVLRGVPGTRGQRRGSGEENGRTRSFLTGPYVSDWLSAVLNAHNWCTKSARKGKLVKSLISVSSCERPEARKAAAQPTAVTTLQVHP